MIVWLASYPQSGNNFVRSLLSSYIFSEDGSFDAKLLENIDLFPNNFCLASEIVVKRGA